MPRKKGNRGKGNAAHKTRAPPARTIEEINDLINRPGKTQSDYRWRQGASIPIPDTESEAINAHVRALYKRMNQEEAARATREKIVLPIEKKRKSTGDEELKGGSKSKSAERERRILEHIAAVSKHNVGRGNKEEVPRNTVGNFGSRVARILSLQRELLERSHVPLKPLSKTFKAMRDQTIQRVREQLEMERRKYGEEIGNQNVRLKDIYREHTKATLGNQVKVLSSRISLLLSLKKKDVHARAIGALLNKLNRVRGRLELSPITLEELDPQNRRRAKRRRR